MIKKFYAGSSSRFEFAALWFSSLFILEAFSKWAGYTKTGTSANIAFIVALLCVAICAGAAIRRMHDLGRSGWWALTILIPFVGLYFLFAKGVNPYKSSKQPSGIFEADTAP